MKYLLAWVWHGENFPRRLASALLSVGGLLTALTTLPEDAVGWIRFGAGIGMALIGGLLSKPEVSA